MDVLKCDNNVEEELAASESSGKSLKVLVTLEDLDRLLPDQED